MDRDKKQGVMFIIIGLLIPLAVLPFVTGFSRDKGLYANFYYGGIEIGRAAEVGGPAGPAPVAREGEPKVGTKSFLPARRIPFRFFLVPTVILIYVGIMRIERSRRRKQEN